MTSPIEDRLIPSLDEVVSAIRETQCILFLGAGVHAPPPADSGYLYGNSERPLIGGELSLRLAEISKFAERRSGEDPNNLQRVSLDFELQKGRARLIDEVRSAVQSGKRPSPLMGQLAALPFRVIITTNYDTHFEDSARMLGKKPFVSFYRSNVTTDERTLEYPLRKDPSPEAPLVLKIHGDIMNDAASIVITDEDYIQFIRRMGDKEPYQPLPRTVLYLMARWPTLFLGYSLLDYNLRLLFKTLRWRLPPGDAPEMYSVDYRPNPLILEVLQNYRREVKYIVEDVWRFVPELAKEINRERGSL